MTIYNLVPEFSSCRSILGWDVLMALAQCPSLGRDQESPRPRGESRPRPASAQSPSDPPLAHTPLSSDGFRRNRGGREDLNFKPC